MEKQCRLCQKSVCNEDDFTKIEALTIEMFDTLLLKPGASLKKGSIICNTCSEVIQKLFDFKCACLYAEDVLYPLIKPGETLEIREVYLKKYVTKKPQDIPDVPKICRLCLELIDRAYPLQIMLNKNTGTVVNTLQTYLPELNLKAVKRPILCKTCLETLKLFSRFIGEYLKFKAAEPQVENDEENETNEEPECTPAEENPTENNEENTENNEKNTEENCGIIYSKGNVESENNYWESVRRKFKRRHNAVSYRRQRYRCRYCGYQAGQICIMKKHMLHHLPSTRVQLYKCGICEFQTKYKYGLKTHLKTHLGPTFDCDECKSKFKRAAAYLRHKKMHAMVKSRVYRCASCDFKTKHKFAYDYHQLNHKAESEVVMMICHTCGYTTRHKSQLRKHMGVHRPPDYSKMLECKKCDYVAKKKSQIRNHMRTHQDLSEAKVFKCDICAYQTKHKYTLKAHAVVHLAPGEAAVFECDRCTYRTNRITTLRAHKKRHEERLKLEGR